MEIAKVADDIRSKHAQEKKSTSDVAEESKEPATEETKKIDFDEEIATYLQGQSFKTGEARKLMDKIVVNYDEKEAFK